MDRDDVIGGLSFSVLGSSSSGNCTLVTDGDTTILLDAGLPVGYTVEKLREMTGSESVEGIFVSHEHSDHVRNLAPLARYLSCPVYLSQSVSWYLNMPSDVKVVEIRGGSPVLIGDLRVTPFPVPHDAIDPFGFIVEGKGGSMALITDLGTVNESIVDLLKGREGLVIESNHDSEMLLNGSYPPYLKNRIMNGRGHLSNQQCKELLRRVVDRRTREIVLVHLSEENNDPLLAVETSMDALKGQENNASLHVSYPRNPTGLFRLYL